MVACYSEHIQTLTKSFEEMRAGKLAIKKHSVVGRVVSATHSDQQDFQTSWNSNREKESGKKKKNMMGGKSRKKERDGDRKRKIERKQIKECRGGGRKSGNMLHRAKIQTEKKKKFFFYQIWKQQTPSK